MSEETGEIIQPRSGTRAELLASQIPWIEGEIGHITDEECLILAEADGLASDITFKEYGIGPVTKVLSIPVGSFGGSSAVELASIDIPAGKWMVEALVVLYNGDGYTGGIMLSTSSPTAQGVLSGFCHKSEDDTYSIGPAILNVTRHTVVDLDAIDIGPDNIAGLYGDYDNRFHLSGNLTLDDTYSFKVWGRCDESGEQLYCGGGFVRFTKVD